MLEIKNLSKNFDNAEVLNIPHLNVKKGELLGIVGNNGAGKTTLFRLCLDLLKAESGNIEIENQDVSQTEMWKKITGSFINERFLIDFLTPEEYFAFIADCYGKDVKACKQKLSEFHGFMNGEILNQKKFIHDFSSGNKQKIGIIGAVLPEPEILILDEPFNYLDPTSQFFIRDYLSALNKNNGTTIIISSHNLECIYDIATRLIVLEKGKIVKQYDAVDIHVKEELKDYFKLH